MRTETVTIYEYDELPTEAAKEKAREWFREVSRDDTFWHESVTEDFAENLAPLLGWDIGKPRHARTGYAVYFSGFWSQGDGAQFEGDWSAQRVKSVKEARGTMNDKEFLALVARYKAFARSNPNATASVKTDGRYCHEYCTAFDFDDGRENRAGYRVEREKTFIELSRDVMRWLYRRLETEYEYQNADEQIAETIRAKGYEFTADGARA